MMCVQVNSLENQVTVSFHLVISEKYKDGEWKKKARSVACSFEENINNLRMIPQFEVGSAYS